jgi:eukaryotic-like serine/threonine-protein kinase
VVHRDLKPDNVVLAGGDESTDAASGRALLVDFGGVQEALAAGDDGERSLGTTIVGTAGYTPPEQFGGGASTASDMYALGGVVLFLLSGKPPGAFGAARLRVAWEKQVDVSGPLRKLLQGTLEPIAEDRITAQQVWM